MNNPILHSESFDRSTRDFVAASTELARSLRESTESLQQSINRLAVIEGMKAENSYRAFIGETPAYTEGDFRNA